MKTLRDMHPHKFWRSPEVVGFVEKIAANPEDDLPRLVFADWLQDTACGDVDNAHADFIRQQIANPGYDAERFTGFRFVKARVYAGFDTSDISGGNVPLVERWRGPFPVFARVERGFLSKVVFAHKNPEDTIDRLLAWIDRNKPDGVLPAMVDKRKTAARPIGSFHPYYVYLDDAGLLNLYSFRGMHAKTAAGFGCVAVEYHGDRFEFPHVDLWKLDKNRIGEHVISNTLTRYWERRFKDFGFPVRVIVSPEVVADINTGVSRTL